MTATPEMMKQIAAQCRVVAHLATVLAEVHADYERMFAEPVKSMEGIADMVGRRTASIMEKLGDILNGMDACSEDDEWTAPIFHEAQRLWPIAS